MTKVLIPFVAVAMIVGCGEGDDRGRVEPVSYRATAGSPGEQVLSAAGLTLDVACTDNHGEPLLSLGASTAVDDALISSEFDQRRAPRAGYRFVMADFDRDDGPWDFLGKGNHEVTGTLQFAAPDGAHVTVEFIADQVSDRGDCLFSGTALVADG